MPTDGLLPVSGSQDSSQVQRRLTNEQFLRTRQLMWFTNRDTEMDTLAAAIDSNSQVRLLHLTGIAGIGKSTVLAAWEDFCRRRGVVYARVNLGGQRTPESILVELFAQLAETDSELAGGRTFLDGRFMGQLGRLRSIRGLLESADTASNDTRAMAVGSYDPVRQGESAVITERVLAEVAEIVGRDDAEFLFNPTEALTRALIDDVESWHNEVSRICLFFDQYEQVGASVDAWIRTSLFPGLSSVLMVCSGRGPLPAGWSRWRSMIHEIRVNPLSREDTQRLVAKAANTDSAIAWQIVELSAGLPLAAGLAIDLLNETDGRLELGQVQGREMVKQLVDLFLADVPRELVTWVQRAAIVRSFNEDTLVQMATEADIDPVPIFEHLAGLSITQLHADGLAIHDAVRGFLNQDLQVRAPSRYADLNRRAYQYYSFVLSTSLTSSARRDAQIEQLYHQIRYDPEEGLLSMRNMIESTTLLSQLEVSEAVLSLAAEVSWTDEQALWVRYMDALVRQQRNTDNRGSAQILDGILADRRCTDPDLRVRAAAYLAMNTWYLGDFTKSLHWAALAIEGAERLEHVTGFAHIATEAKALTLNRMGRFVESIDVQQQLLQSARSTGDRVAEAWGQNNLGYMKWHLGEWQAAVGHLDESRMIFDDLHHPYGGTYPQCHKALIYIRCGRLDEAFQLLQTTLDVCRDRGNREIEAKSLQNLCDYWIASGDPGRAETTAAEALEIAVALDLPFYQSETHRRRGEARLAGGRAAEAYGDFTNAGVLAREMNAHYSNMRCLLGQAKAELAMNGVLSSEVLAVIMDAGTEEHPGYGELRSHFWIFSAGLALARGDAIVAADQFTTALHAASTFNAVALEHCAESIVAVSSEFGHPELARDVRNRWLSAVSNPATAAKFEVASLRVGTLRTCVAPEVVLARGR